MIIFFCESERSKIKPLHHPIIIERSYTSGSQSIARALQ